MFCILVFFFYLFALVGVVCLFSYSPELFSVSEVAHQKVGKRGISVPLCNSKRQKIKPYCYQQVLNFECFLRA